MNTRIIIIVVGILGCIAALCFTYRSLYVDHVNVHEVSPNYRIAFFVPAVHPSMDSIEQGVRDSMPSVDTRNIIIDTYNANGNRTLLRAQAEEIVQGNYDVIITVGAQCSHVTRELLT